jgi:hypothetical protein
MPGPITYAAITFLARDRLGHMRDVLTAKAASGGALTPLELQIQYLAGKAHDMLGQTQPSIQPPRRLYGPPIGDNKISKFALMGSVGPDITAYAARFVPGQRWLVDTMHKGSPDENREKVLVRSTDFVLKFWEKVSARVTTDASRAAMQAYALGHLCHVAADVVSHPYVDDVAAHLSTAGAGGIPALTRQQVIGGLEVEVSQKFLGRGTTTRGADWPTWWPGEGDVPSEFYPAFKDTLEELYGPGARQPGFGAFEKQLGDDDPPDLSEDLLKDGYRTFLSVAAASNWNMLDWMGGTFLMFLPSLPLPLLMAALHGKDAYRDPPPAGFQKFRSQYEAFFASFALNALVPLGATLLLSFSYVGIGKETVFGWVSAGLQALAGILFFSTLGVDDDAWRTIMIIAFAVFGVVEIVHFGYVVGRSGGDHRLVQLALGSFLHVLLSLTFALLYPAFLHLATEELDDRLHGPDPDDDKLKGFLWKFLLWFLIVVAIWIILSFILNLAVKDLPPADVAQTFAAQQRHHVRLFDDTTLFRAPAPTSPTLADLHYPSGRRELLKLFWTGTRTLAIHSDRDRLVFQWANAAATNQTVFAPIAPATPSEYAAYLVATVRDPGDAAGRLTAQVVYAGDLDYELPPGEVFSDNGDNQTSEAGHDAGALGFAAVGGDADHSFTLFHAPKVRQAVRFDSRGPVQFDEDRKTATAEVPASTVASNAAAGSRELVGTGTRFLRFLKPGDVILASGQQRIVESITDDTHLVLSTQFAPLIGQPPGGPVAWQRDASLNRQLDLTAPPAWLLTPAANTLNDVNGAGAVFGQLLRTGDMIRVTPPAGPVREYTVLALGSDTRLTLDAPLPPNTPAAGLPFTRIGDETAFGFNYVADTDDTLYGGGEVMNQAADLAAILCMGGVSHLISQQDRAAAPGGGLNKVFQVFRNWNLDRRRVNEWKMLVAGGAVSEKRGNPAAADAALFSPLPPEWSMFAPTGEAVANQLGWTELLRHWVDMARRPANRANEDVSFKAGDPTNLALSRGLAFLFDMRNPVP